MVRVPPRSTLPDHPFPYTTLFRSAQVDEGCANMLVNRETGRAAVQRRARSLTDDDGAVHVRVRLVWPLSDSVAPAEALEASHWAPADRAMFSAAWEAELAGLPDFETSTLQIDRKRVWSEKRVAYSLYLGGRRQ